MTLTSSCDRTVVVILRGFHIAPCCDDTRVRELRMGRRHERPHCEPKARPCKDHFRLNISHSFDGDGWERVWAVRNCYSRTMVENCEWTLDLMLLRNQII